MLTPTVTTIQNQPARTTQQDLGKKDIFLKLLVAQMQNQDPLKPQDPTKMASQLAQFNMVEQQISTNKLLGQLVGAGNSTGGQSTSAATYLGHSVTVNQNQIHYDGTVQTFTATLDAAATQTRVTIFDTNGVPVRTMQLANLSAGVNALNWDGLMDSGATAPQGNYRIDISATDLQGNAVKSSVQHSGIVTAVRFNASGTELMVGGIAALPSDITEIRL
ncbi:MAG: flagellar hook capping FlgD N-terminal domain-containing protein [Mariprofundaceae bacterium]|nr:flagellar hook capping FlgD N-terminal domain-containing protein [Mariprofundaceae bacterium]